MLSPITLRSGIRHPKYFRSRKRGVLLNGNMIIRSLNKMSSLALALGPYCDKKISIGSSRTRFINCSWANYSENNFFEEFAQKWVANPLIEPPINVGPGPTEIRRNNKKHITSVIHKQDTIHFCRVEHSTGSDI